MPCISLEVFSGFQLISPGVLVLQIALLLGMFCF